MAKQDIKTKLTIICDRCGKQILAAPNVPYPVDYVYRDGTNLCWDCIKHSDPINNHR